MSQIRKAPEGILGFPVAPFNGQGKLEEEALFQNIQFLLDEGLEAIFIACGSGEFQSLSRAEYEQMVEIAVSAAGGKVPVYTGVGGNLSTAVEWAELSAEKGADGYLILPPYLIKGEQEGLYQYTKTIIESTDLNAIIYQRDHAVLTLGQVERLTELKQLVGLKDGAGDMDLNISLSYTLGDRLGLLNGMPMAEVTMPAYAPIGFTSYSSAISNYIPHISRMFYEALLNGNKQLAKDLYKHVILPINDIRKQRKGYAVSLIKAGMEIMGLNVKNVARPPIVPVEKDHCRQLETILKNAMDRYPKKTAAI
ncbi:5-dehydro-4-deoxyglucarate dehydratase [Bacillus glycinifermentans]|uniref:Probable 5-dehydro-4-deoxyglucarate dehydratase n=1 Tax=Bacillus glycinifermentans TaxID=1664069 RepID=A0A0J6ERL9_9BACI|nr:5-dehydro-4-deoxyglucarate dehydratase [Bacillus glycinifermentans]ATH94216.1 5-dehydro-4-deoxyglucarate dehydratase [Bacillus glycinifermentans]KMM63111.1 5-dehydro-4-deoxyglucarate dehydratase [Bacillus glycinifermentans]KRT95640.1 5-dehydro-4-deoxyglucarate dehydratase [Bacillus glycinifermentans]MEC0484481.1 5-dehydro-4-deoxyglucarate dehydratase [Bacillus glycinifermentans]MEC0496873.1 5-dehydro-4-deoxyglucarate dehydratase [Bacillus glycinifermentans]